MSDYSWLQISKPADYHNLEAILEDVFAPKSVAPQLAASISAAVKGVLVEYGYVDKDYRSTYYHFYAKKGRRYRDDCIRLHLFDEAVSFAEDRVDIGAPDGALSDHYFGYIVLRPTLTATIGRSILSPDVRAGARGAGIQSEHVVHVLGHDLQVWGFPSMKQHADISVCAHVSCWAILRHYSERYPSHREILIHDITLMAHPFDPGGLTPALGLNVAQAERIFQAAGSFPLIVSKRSDDDSDFYVQMLAYLESGFPLFVAMHGQEHAIVAIGNSWRRAPRSGVAPNHVWPWVEAIVAVDDNQLPYECVPVDPLDCGVGEAEDTAGAKAGDSDSEGGNTEGGAVAISGHRYSVADFDSFIVPLPDKIFYPADAVERQAAPMEVLMGAYFKPKPKGELIRRYFIMTLSGLRKYARASASQLGDDLVSAIMKLRSARFVWIVEYATAEQWANGHVYARAVLDATASPNDPVPIWLMHDEQMLVSINRGLDGAGGDAIELNRPKGAPIGRIEQNLRPIRKLS